MGIPPQNMKHIESLETSTHIILVNHQIALKRHAEECHSIKLELTIRQAFIRERTLAVTGLNKVHAEFNRTGTFALCAYR